MLSYIRLVLHTCDEGYDLYLGISALDRLEINLSALEKLENWSSKRKENTNLLQQGQEHIRIFDNQNNELVVVGKQYDKPLPDWLAQWLEERGYHISADRILKVIPEQEFSKALADAAVYYFGRNKLTEKEAA